MITEEHKRVTETLLKESDRGCVIFGAAIISEELEALLRAHSRTDANDIKNIIDPLFQGYAPLSSFLARIQITFALGLLPRETRNKLEIIRRLRNEFAHDSGPIDFDDSRCSNRLKILIGDNLQDFIDKENITFLHKPLTASSKQLVTRLAFICAIGDIITRIRALTVSAKSGRDVRQIVAELEIEDTKK